MKNYLTCYGYLPWAKQILKKMKLTVLLLTLAILSSYATDSYSQAARLTLNMENSTIGNVLKAIEDQSEFRFFYSGAVNTDTKASVSVSDKNVMETLDELFRGSGIRYEIYGRQIALLAGKETSLPSGVQQSGAITGKVTDRTGTPLPGVTVVIKGTTTGTITDNNGNFAIGNIKPNTVLVFSFVGMRTQEIPTEGRTTLTLILDEETIGVDEVVVVGYGTQRKINVTGAVTSVDIEKNLAGRSIPDVGRGLQGVAPGLSVTLPDGEVGSDPRIKIRGAIGSIQGSSSPLILLDNVEIPSIQVVNPDDIESISILKDAASASIYGSKGAFGVVLITTKKGAKIDKVNVSYTGLLSWQNLSKPYEMAGVEGLQYMLDARARETAGQYTGHYSYDGIYVGAYFRVDETSLKRSYEWQEKYGGKLGVNDPMVYGRDWYYQGGRIYGVRPFNIYDYMIKENAPSTQNNFSVNGKNKNTSFNIGLGYLGQSGMMKTAKDDNFTRYNASTRIETQVNEWLTVRSGMIYSSRSKKYPFLTESTSDGPWLYLYRWSPLVPLGYNEDGEIIRSPMNETMQAASANIQHNYTSVNAGITLKPMKDWNINMDYTFSNQEYIHTLPGATLSGADYRGTPVRRYDSKGNQIYVNSDGEQVDANTPGAMVAYKLPYAENYNGTSKPNLFKREHENSYRHTINALSDYNLTINNIHKLKFMLGLNMSTYDATSQYTQVTELSDFENPQFAFGTGTWTGGGSASWQAQLGYFGRINYSMLDKYLLEVNIRYDGTSKFPTNLKWEWFPSFSGGWVLSEEKFMEWTKPVLSSLKLRSSWGSIGDQTVSSSLYIPTMSTGLNNWIGGNGSLLSLVGTPSAVSAGITWQAIETFDVGIEGRFWDGRFGFELDWFQRHTKNMIVPTDGVNTVTYGSSAPMANNGSIRTDGWELSIDGSHRFKNGIGINMTLTLFDAISTITGYGNTKNVNGYYVGKKFGEIWGFKADRLYQWSDFETDGNGNLVYRQLTADDTDDVNSIGKSSYILKLGPNGEKPVYQSYYEGSTFRFGPGDVKFIDANGDGKLDKGTQTIDDHGDLVVIGNSTPRMEYGIRIGADFKGFDLSLFLQGVGKREMWGNGPIAIPGWRTSDGAMAAAFAQDYWTPDNTDAFYPAAYNMGGGNTSYNMNVNDRYLLNMAYTRLKNLTIGYTCPSRYSKKLGMSKARLYFSGENLFTWDKLRGLPLDPEVETGVSMWGSNYSQGRTGVATPTFKTVSMGLQLNF